MKRFLFVIAILFSIVTNAQVTKVSLQANGLTCSMCSNSIFKSLKTVNFVHNIEANIKTSTFEITFKPGASIDFAVLKDKVEDAGYSVAKFIATVRCKDVKVQSNTPVKIGNITLRFFAPNEQSLNGEKQVRVMNKGFVSAKELKKINLEQQPLGIYYVMI
ncbi:MAG: heavy-metal-associated protein [Segetibacter sp.]|jgi:copper chaperone CopZ|nr:heavy-metal-associated protein [Segetibacter sp.]